MQYINIRSNNIELTPENIENLKKWDFVEHFKCDINGFDCNGTSWVEKGAIQMSGGGIIFDSLEEWRNRKR